LSQASVKLETHFTLSSSVMPILIGYKGQTMMY